MRIANIAEAVGDTPIVELKRAEEGLGAKIFAKLEFFEPAGSVKDRVALAMIEDAEARGVLSFGGLIVEPTSGNTGIGLAAIGSAKGYRVCIVMPETMSEERRRLIRAYGAELVLTDGAEGMRGAIARAEEIARARGGIIMGQFKNPSNPAVHYKTTGPEIRRDMEGKVGIFVAGVGTGGTIAGVGKYLKERDPRVKIVAVEPASSPVLTKGTAGAHRIQGIGAGFVPAVLDRTVIDEVVPVTDEDAFETARSIGREGFLAGISSGAALWAAKQLAGRLENAGKNIVVLFPDGGDRYLSTPLFA